MEFLLQFWNQNLDFGVKILSRNGKKMALKRCKKLRKTKSNLYEYVILSKNTNFHVKHSNWTKSIAKCVLWGLFEGCVFSNAKLPSCGPGCQSLR